MILHKNNVVNEKNRIAIDATRLLLLEKTLLNNYENWLEVLFAPPALRAFSPAKYSL
jgi:hypothetical protein